MTPLAAVSALRPRLTLALCVLAILGASTVAAEAATITAASCQRDDVGNAVNSANDGDTIVIPAGTCTWTTNLTISSKILTLQGAGMNQTRIVDGLSKAPYPNVPQVLTYNTKAGGITRITGMTFDGGSGANDDFNVGMVKIGGNSHSFRFDHNRVITTRTAGVMIYGFIWGVLDHNVFELSNWKFGIYTFHDSWNSTGGNGDASWADATYHGTERAIFIEDNTFTSPTVGVAHDGWSGNRVVFRNNTLTNAAFETHGTESGGRLRGQRMLEVYGNRWTYNNGVTWPSVVGIRSGVGVIYNNTATYTGGGFITRVVDAVNYRSDQAFSPWGKCDGSSAYDGNTAGQSGYPCIDQVGRGLGNLLSGTTPTPAAWPQQAVEPTYAWNNTLNGQNSAMVSNTSNHIQQGRDFFNSAKPGYTPYTYPHPLTAGGVTITAPEPPLNVRIMR